MKGMIMVLSAVAILLAAVLSGCSQAQTGDAAAGTDSQASGTANIQEEQTQAGSQAEVVSDDGSAAAGIHEIIVQGKAFRPSEIEIRQGESVVFRKIDNNNHSIVFYDIEEHSGEVLNQARSYEVTFEAKGEYRYKDIASGGSGMILVR